MGKAYPIADCGLRIADFWIAEWRLRVNDCGLRLRIEIADCGLELPVVDWNCRLWIGIGDS
jgi:hypothetical protein